MSSRSGYVYLIEYPDRHYKIGRGKSAMTRFRQLQRTSPRRIYLLWSMWFDDMFAIERNLHQQYGTKRDKRGEYFRLSVEEVEAIASIGSTSSPETEGSTSLQLISLALQNT